ncbi:MAG: hypothetical protein JWO13_777 [Acidobacteriales bacterium]|nr:hypothetical protein [Terriglobales bacterium]
MGGRSKNRVALSALLGALLSAAICPAQTQTTRTVRKHRVAVEDTSVAPAVAQAESALEKQDYATAEKLLVPVVAADPNDYLAWFDLGYVYRATKRNPQAIDAYRKSVALKPTVFASNFHLGMLLSAVGQNDEAAKYLNAATQLKPEANIPDGMYRAWMALAQVLSATKPNEALSALRKASALKAGDAEPHLLAGSLLEKQNDFPGAESEYRAVLAANPQSSPALAGLTRVYVASNRLPDAEKMLQEYVAKNPNDAGSHLQLGRLMMRIGKTDEATQEFETGLKASPQDKDLLRELAAIYANAKKYDLASAQYESLVKANPTDAGLRHEYGVMLLHEKKFPEAQEQLLAALNQDRKMLGAYGDLAVAASENNDYKLAIGVLDARAKLAPDTPATYFLRATAYDNLKAFTQASENYHQFLAVANGQFPDQEWQARHRLIAIEPPAQKTKK